jgi:hypothetical protein
MFRLEHPLGVFTVTYSPYSLAPGTEVEVRSTFDRSWKRGFVVEQASEQGYLLRRRSDGAVLPAAFAPDTVRPAEISSSSGIFG